jgi:hypothetical protein
MTIWSILLQLEIFYGHLVRFVVIWYNFPRFGILDQEKSGNPAPDWIDVDVKCRMSRRTINRCRGTMLSVQLWKVEWQNVEPQLSNHKNEPQKVVIHIVVIQIVVIQIVVIQIVVIQIVEIQIVEIQMSKLNFS